MAKWDLPADPVLAAKVVEHEARRGESGIMGKIFGIAGEKQGNIAAFVLIVFLCIFAGELIWGTDTATLSKKDTIAIISSLITLTLGFVFGQKASAKSE